MHCTWWRLQMIRLHWTSEIWPSFLYYFWFLSYCSFLDAIEFHFDALFAVHYTLLQRTWLVYRLSKCIEQYKTLPIFLNCSISVCYFIDCIDELFSGPLNCSTLNCSVHALSWEFGFLTALNKKMLLTYLDYFNPILDGGRGEFRPPMSFSTVAPWKIVKSGGQGGI